MRESQGRNKRYQVEILVDKRVMREIFGANFSHSQYPLILKVLQMEVGGDIELMVGQLERIGREPSDDVSIGLLSVGDDQSLLNLIDFIISDRSIQLGSIQAEGGESVYVEDEVDEELVRDIGGIVLRDDNEGMPVIQLSTSEALEYNRHRGVYQSSESLSVKANQASDVEINRDEISDRVAIRAENVDEQLEHIPDSYVMPEPDEMTIGSAKQFQLGIVFVDIAGFSDYAYRNNDEDVLFMLNVFIPEIMEIVRDTDGDFEKNTGDGILAYFGAGESDKWTSHLVLTYIATIKTALANYVNPTLEEYGVEPVGIKVGAAMGDVYISRIGVNRLNRRTVVGEAANVASKLEDEADTHEFFVSEEIKEIADEADCMWAEYLRHRGVLSGFEKGDENGEYYDFIGIWESTKESNFVQ